MCLPLQWKTIDHTGRTAPDNSLKQYGNEFAWRSDDGTALIHNANSETEWWTFAGVGANATRANEFEQILKSRVTYDSFTVTFAPHVSFDAIAKSLDEPQARDVKQMRPTIEQGAILGLKFSECLPDDLAVHVLEIWLRDPAAIEQTLHQFVHRRVSRFYG